MTTRNLAEGVQRGEEPDPECEWSDQYCRAAIAVDEEPGDGARPDEDERPGAEEFRGVPLPLFHRTYPLCLFDARSVAGEADSVSCARAAGGRPAQPRRAARSHPRDRVRGRA